MSEIALSEYLHHASIGDEINAQKVGVHLKHNLREWLDNKEITGYRIYYVPDEQKAIDKLILVEYQEVTKGAFPFIYAGVKPVAKNDPLLDEKMAALGFSRIYIPG